MWPPLAIWNVADRVTFHPTPKGMAHSMERLPVEKAITETIKAYKAIQLKK
jgi:hypothetical protein